MIAISVKDTTTAHHEKYFFIKLFCYRRNFFQNKNVSTNTIDTIIIENEARQRRRNVENMEIQNVLGSVELSNFPTLCILRKENKARGEKKLCVFRLNDNDKKLKVFISQGEEKKRREKSFTH